MRQDNDNSEACVDVLAALEPLEGFFPDSYGAVRLPDREQQNLLVDGSHLGRPALVKIYHAHASERFENERQTLIKFAQFGLPVATALDHGAITLYGENRQYLVMSLLPGKSLHSQIPGLASKQAANFGRAIAGLMQLQKTAWQTHYAPSGTKLLLSSWQRLYRQIQLEMPKLVSKAFLDLHCTTADDLAEPPNLHWVTHDWRLRHLLVADESICGLLDLEYTRPNDFAAEIGHLLQDMMQFRGDGFRALRLAFFDELEALGLFDCRDFEARVQSYMARQALSSCLSSYRRGLSEADLSMQIADILRYNGSRNLKILLRDDLP